ncbi:PP2C family protein-serine/threonine phosphatase [Leucobacter soli]|uniref:PP2C family protein-serine/threonine phosphatase n=1 Tax=Leucobacter soli TaxID=2812850 RepID=UPI003619F7E3
MSTRGKAGLRERVPLGGSASPSVELSWYGISEIGRRRETNQDSFVTLPPLFAVADGMGGHSAGEIASAAAVRRLAELGGATRISDGDIEEALGDAVDDIELEAGESELGAGTTATGVVLGDDPEQPSWRVFNIGDSRVYQYFDGELTQLTVDHSVVQHLLDTGAITEEEAEYHPHANVITRAVGFNEPPVPDFSSVALIPGQRLLICSDGLTKELTDAGIEHFLRTGESAEGAAHALVQHALDNAGRDNITVIVIEVHRFIESQAVDGAAPESGAAAAGPVGMEHADADDTLEVPKV